MSKNTVRAFIKGFEEAGIIKTENYCPDGKTQGQTVFILGTWTKVNGVIVESLYRDAVFISSETGQKLTSLKWSKNDHLIEKVVKI